MFAIGTYKTVALNGDVTERRFKNNNSFSAKSFTRKCTRTVFYFRARFYPKRTKNLIAFIREFSANRKK